MEHLSGLQRVIGPLNINPNFTLWVGPNPGILSRTLQPADLCTNMEGLLISLFSDPALLPRMIGGNLLVKLGNIWVYDGEETSKRLEIGLISSCKFSIGGRVLCEEF